MSHLFGGAAHLDLTTLPSRFPTAPPLTLASRYCPAAFGSSRYLIELNNATDSFQLFAIFVVGGQNARMTSQDAGVGVANSSNLLSLNRWSSVVGVTSSTASRFVMLDGVFSAINTTSVSPLTPTFATVGASKAGGSFGTFANGNMADVAIWSAALTCSEAMDYYLGKPVDQIRPDSLALYLPLDRDIFDRSRSRATLTNTSAIPVSDAPAMPAMRGVLRSFPGVAGDVLFAGQ